ncbi:peptide ABC transporter permease [Candidatus Epulonipiscium fishelsonii]|uniref:Peptide ABC transporter permease n=1 Tax=Candidatus Epulonipiscium fishelsonii TaxID=77094 RepID=A0ACC8XDT0_9FIRM|nr:peptide ABC transporter permease [Epulopiscium sp. SCG-B05WGA-EpuloA1]ONI41066.1 peptide ABC transporter permease [Epulopiscium sp. SCG-B11WGA-EpuloA1]
MEFLENDFEFVGEKHDIYVEEVLPVNSFWKDFFKRLKKNKGAIAGGICIIIIVLFAIIAPAVSPFEFDKIDTSIQSTSPNGTYLFGTDVLGRDLFVRVWSGTRISLFVALTAVIIDICFGMVYGLISGYFGGKVDNIMQRVQEIISSIPSLVILTLLLVIMKASLFTIILALMLTGWIGMARITRAQVLKIKEEEYVLASKTLGASHMFIIFKNVLPNIFGQLIIMSMFSIPNAIFYEAFLAFVGLGIPQPQASLGTLINDGFKTILITPYMVIIPVVVLAILMLSFNLLADGLRDAFDPTMKEA